MYGLSRLNSLQEINLSNNSIVTIEGLKELVHLRHLNLQSNHIKSIEHLNTNVGLEYLNLSENSIGTILDISMLKNLKVWPSQKCYFYSRNSLIFQVPAIMTMNLFECYTHHLGKLNALMQSENRVIAKQWTWTCISILHERAWHTEILFQTLFFHSIRFSTCIQFPFTAFYRSCICMGID